MLMNRYEFPTFFCPGTRLFVIVELDPTCLVPHNHPGGVEPAVNI